MLASTSAVVLNTTVSQTPYLVTRYIKGDMTTVSLLFLLALVSAGGFVVIVLLKMKSLEKKTLFYMGAFFWYIFFIILPFVNAESTYLLYIDAIFFGAGLCGAMVAPPALLTDAAAVLESDTGYRSEASLYAGMHMLSKLQQGLTGALFQLGLWIESPSTVNSSTTINDQGILSIRILTVAIPVILLTVAVISNIRLSKRFTRDQIKIMQVDLDERKARASVDNSLGEVASDQIRRGEAPYLTYVVIDGVNSELFAKLSASGKLPNLTALAQAGTYVENAVASFPSTWGYGLYPILTGKAACVSGIAGHNWFNRRSRFNAGQRSYGGLAMVYLNAGKPQ